MPPTVDQPANPPRDSTVLVSRLREVEHLTPEELDRLPFGVIKVDRAGTILAYNAAESNLAGRTAAEVLGRNFFVDVAPCTNVPTFADRFRQGIARGGLRDVFPFTFRFPGGPVVVSVTLLHEAGADCAWIFVERSG
jgi:chemotaxis family two-component system sensor kinase Cph1